MDHTRTALPAFILAAVLCLVPNSLRAQPSSKDANRTLDENRDGVRSARQLLGAEVVSPRGEGLGTLADFVFDARSGVLSGAVLRFGGLAGIAWQTAVLPAGLLRAQNGPLVADASPQSLARLPPFAELEWPAMRASVLLGREVIDAARRDAGEIVDLQVNLREGRIEQASIELRDDSKLGSRLVQVPIPLFSLPRDLGDFVALNVDREHLGRLSLEPR